MMWTISESLLLPIKEGDTLRVFHKKKRANVAFVTDSLGNTFMQVSATEWRCDHARGGMDVITVTFE